jgi:ADP-ribose pyrophosphatase
MPTLPELPQVELDVLSVTDAKPDGFLTLRRWDLVVVTPEKRSQPYRYDTIDRRALDAAVMVAHTVGQSGAIEVYLRSAVRPPISLRTDEHKARPVIWELPAGLIEPGEEPAAAAAREVAEELGFDVMAEEMKQLGAWAYPAPGFVGEIHHFFHVRVDPSKQRAPDGDGSPMEEVAAIVRVPLADALAACRAGEIRDEKTELALRRLAEALA